MISIKLITNGTLAIAFDVYSGEPKMYYGHIEYRKWNNEMRFEHRSGYYHEDVNSHRAKQLALEQIVAITVEEEILS